MPVHAVTAAGTARPPAVDPPPLDLAAVAGGEPLAPSTVLAYARWWRRWGAWCAVNEFTALPATADTLARFVAELAFDGTSASGIRQAIGAVRAAHRSAGFPRRPDRLEAASERHAVERELVVSADGLVPEGVPASAAVGDLASSAP